MSHTPGPWEFVTDEQRAFVVYSNSIDGRGVATGPLVGLPREEDFANGRLIAAAPDQHEALFDALRVLRGFSDRWSFSPKDSLPVLDRDDIAEIREAMWSVSNAIAKVEGAAEGVA